MTPGACFTHVARIDGIGKKRARDYTGGLKSAASVNREFYHRRVTFPGKLLHQFDSDPESLVTAASAPTVIRGQTAKISTCEEILAELPFPRRIFPARVGAEFRRQIEITNGKVSRAIRLLAISPSRRRGYEFVALCMTLNERELAEVPAPRAANAVNRYRTTQFDKSAIIRTRRGASS